MNRFRQAATAILAASSIISAVPAAAQQAKDDTLYMFLDSARAATPGEQPVENEAVQTQHYSVVCNARTGKSYKITGIASFNKGVPGQLLDDTIPRSLKIDIETPTGPKSRADILDQMAEKNLSPEQRKVVLSSCLTLG